MSDQADPNYATLSERVSGIEKSIGQISASVASLASDIRDRQKFPWPAIFGFVSVLLVVIGMIGAIVIWGFNSYLSGVTASFDRQQTQLADLAAGIVPRGEHSERWRSFEAEDDDLQRQLDQLRESFGGAYSLNDVLAAALARIDRLEELRLQQTVPQATVDGLPR